MLELGASSDSQRLLLVEEKGRLCEESMVQERLRLEALKVGFEEIFDGLVAG